MVDVEHQLEELTATVKDNSAKAKTWSKKLAGLQLHRWERVARGTLGGCQGLWPHDSRCIDSFGEEDAAAAAAEPADDEATPVGGAQKAARSV
jgi:hypothetical protein